MKPENHPFSELSPDFILDAIESRGFRVDARILELNSYENRVFQIGIENREPIIAKFYRPDRWSQDQVQEEHDFLLELASNELSVVAPISLGDTTQFKAGKFMVALFERRGGRTPLIESESKMQEGIFRCTHVYKGGTNATHYLMDTCYVYIAYGTLILL